MARPKLKLFIDASVFIAASASPVGGSAFILQACQKKLFQPVSTKLVLQEAKKNISQKLDEKTLIDSINWLKRYLLKSNHRT